MANTYTLIASTTVGAGGAANIEFTSIPSTYTDLKIVASIRSNYADVVEVVKVRFNGDSSDTGYSSINIRGSGSSTASSSDSYARVGIPDGNNATSNTFGNLEFYIPNYAGSNQKSISSDSVSENNATEAYAALVASLWTGTSAISSLKILPVLGTSFNQYSTAYLYGIKNS